MSTRNAHRFVGKVAVVTGAAQGMGKQVALDMASDESSYITGETVNINGGYYMD